MVKVSLLISVRSICRHKIISIIQLLQAFYMTWHWFETFEVSRHFSFSRETIDVTDKWQLRGDCCVKTNSTMTSTSHFQIVTYWHSWQRHTKRKTHRHSDIMLTDQDTFTHSYSNRYRCIDKLCLFSFQLNSKLNKIPCATHTKNSCIAHIEEGMTSFWISCFYAHSS